MPEEPKAVVACQLPHHEKVTTSNEESLDQRSSAISVFTHPRTARLTRRSEFQVVQNTGRKAATRHLVILHLKTELPTSRLGITVSTKVDKRAVVRNRIKRRLREIFRTNRATLHASFDIVIIARHNAAACSFQELTSEVLGAFKRENLLS